MSEEVQYSFSPSVSSLSREMARKMKKSKSRAKKKKRENFAPFLVTESRDCHFFTLSLSLSLFVAFNNNINHGECKKTHLSHFFLPCRCMNYFTSLHRTARVRMLSSFLRFLFFSLSLSLSLFLKSRRRRKSFF